MTSIAVLEKPHLGRRELAAGPEGPTKDYPKNLIFQGLPPILSPMDETVELRPGRFSDRLGAYRLDTIPFAVGAAATVWVWGGPLHRPITNRLMLGAGGAWLGLAV